MQSTAAAYNFQSHDFRRKYERKNYSADIVFSSNGRALQGTLKNISIGGVFVKCKHTQYLTKGEQVTISVPFTNGNKHVKRTGYVLWKNSIGFALSFYQ